MTGKLVITSGDGAVHAGSANQDMMGDTPITVRGGKLTVYARDGQTLVIPEPRAPESDIVVCPKYGKLCVRIRSGHPLSATNVV